MRFPLCESVLLARIKPTMNVSAASARRQRSAVLVGAGPLDRSGAIANAPIDPDEIGAPHPTQALALSLTDRPHSLHTTIVIETLGPSAARV
jgi:hypothetical protein